MSDNERRIIDYDAFNDLPPNSWLIVDSEGQGTGKIAPIKIGATYEIQDGAHSFTLVGSNGYTHTVDIPYDSVQMSYADYQALSEVQKMDGTNRFVPDVPTDDLEPEIWQRVGRTPLTTVEKTISPAINELKGRIDDSDSEIEDIKSNLNVKGDVVLLGTLTTANTEYTLTDTPSNYKTIKAVSYYDTGTNFFVLDILEIPIILWTTGRTFILCMNDGTIRKGQFSITDTNKVKTGASGNAWQNLTGVYIYGVK